MTTIETDQEYLDAMLQRISAFQRHQHPAWDESLTFDKRVNGLPLYALDFNNPDRDVKQHGPTIAHYAPARCEMNALARTIESVVPNPRILDVGCGNGFIGSLLAREGMSVIGIDDLSWNQPQITRFFDERVYELRSSVSMEAFDDDFDVAFCSWMVPGANLTPMLVARRPTIIIHIYSLHLEKDGRQQTGSGEAYRLPEDFKSLGAWVALSPANFFAEIEPRLSKKSDFIRIVDVWCRRDVPRACFRPPSDSENIQGYPWDSERGALNTIRHRRGLPIFEIRVRP